MNKESHQMKQIKLKIGVCSLNQDPLDYHKNYERIVQSIKKCKQMECMIRVGSEMQICGYYCNDHFCQYDTIYHCWQIIRDILLSGVTNGIVTDIGCPVLHKAALYNCRVILFNSKVVAIRPKMIMADGDNYFETRYFASWNEKYKIDEFFLPIQVQEITGQTKVPIGIFIINFNDTRLAYQICEQSWISKNPMIEAALDGAEIFINPSASYIQRGKLERKIQMISEFTQRHGGCYVYVNGKGSSGDRVYMDGGCMCTQNGKIRFLSDLNNLDDVQITTVIANINSIRTFRLSNKSFQKETNCINKLPHIPLDVNVAVWNGAYYANSPEHMKRIQRLLFVYKFPHVTFEPSLFLWQCLRKTKASGFMLALSGGVDSCCVALIVYNMCVVLCHQILVRKSKQVLNDLRKVVRDSQFVPTSPQKLCGQLLHTIYLGTNNSSQQTKTRAKKIAQTLGTSHRQINFQNIIQSAQQISKQSAKVQLKYKKSGGSQRSDLALQNIQARTRMVLTYFFSLIQLEATNKQGFLLVLGSSNLDESLRGYFTKYDCSSADYNPIGSFSKSRLRQFLAWNKKIHNFEFIDQVLGATPTAELRPLQKGQIAQTDEQDMGFTYEQLKWFGYLRKIEKLGPVSMFEKLLEMKKFSDPRVLASKIKNFFSFYARNRHKMTTVTPSFHYDPEGCDDNRFDMRPFIYTTDWKYQFEQIDVVLNKYISSDASEIKTYEQQCIDPRLNLQIKSIYSNVQISAQIFFSASLC